MTFWSVPVTKFFLFEFFTSLYFFLDRKLAPVASFLKTLLRKKLSYTRIEPTLTKVLQYLRKK